MFLPQQKLQLNILSERKMGLALQEFVDKDEKEAIGEIVKLQLRDTQKALSLKNLRDENDIVQEVIKETERSRAEEPSQEEEATTRKVLKVK